MMDKQINLLIDSSGYVGMADHIPIHPAGRPGGIDAAGYNPVYISEYSINEI